MKDFGAPDRDLSPSDIQKKRDKKSEKKDLKLDLIRRAAGDPDGVTYHFGRRTLGRVRHGHGAVFS